MIELTSPESHSQEGLAENRLNGGDGNDTLRDRVHLAGIDAGSAAGDQAFVFGGAGAGRVWVIDQGKDALVYAQTEAGARLSGRVADGADHDWLAGDFILRAIFGQWSATFGPNPARGALIDSAQSAPVCIRFIGCRGRSRRYGSGLNWARVPRLGPASG